MNLSWDQLVVLSVIAFYQIIVITAGILWARRGPGGLAGFHLAGRELGAPVLVFTLMATVLGASSTLGMAGLGVSKGLPGAWWLLSGCLGLSLISLTLAIRVRSMGCFTLPELLGNLYGPRVRLVAGILVTASWTGVIAAQVIAAGKVLAFTFPGHETTLMVLSALVFMAYTAHGGQVSVVRTDVLQFLVILGGFGYLLWKASGSVALDGLEGLSFPTSQEMGLEDVLSMVVVVGSTYLVGPDIYTRLLSSRDPGAARRATLFAAITLVPIAFGITMLGLYARALVSMQNPEQAIPALMSQLMSPWGEGLVTAALLAAFMSSADTTLMTASSILVLDVGRALWPGTKEGQLLRWSRLCVVFVGIAALGVALETPGIISTLLRAYTVFVGGLLVPTLAGLFLSRRPSSGAALLSMICGGTTALLIGSSQPLAGIGVSLIVLIIAAAVSQIFKREK